MTDKEAIERLLEAQATFNENWVDYSGINEAFKVAITALEKQQSVVNENLTSERSTGEWITRTEDTGVNYHFYCPRCNREVIQITDYCPYCGLKMVYTNTESEEKNMKEMTVTEYRKRLMKVFQDTGNDNLIALVCLPNEKDFKAMESLLRNFWNKKGGEEDDKD